MFGPPTLVFDTQDSIESVCNIVYCQMTMDSSACSLIVITNAGGNMLCQSKWIINAFQQGNKTL
jgi:hypothetical protein